MSTDSACLSRLPKCVHIPTGYLFPSELGHDLFDVQSELIPVSANWKSIGTALQLKPDFLRNIDARYSGDPRACLSWMVMEWLMRNYNVGKFGEPTWQKLVEAVGHPAGGANIALAKKIARRHKAGGTLCHYENILLPCWMSD